MRYKLGILILLLTLGFTAKAQVEDPIEAPLQQQNVDTEEKLKTLLGVKCTLGGHTFQGSAFEHNIPMFGFGVGMFNVINLNKKKMVKLQWELNLTNKGSKFSRTGDTGYSKIAVSYAELPVMLSFQLNKDKNPFHVLIGAQFSYMFKSSISQGLGQYGEVKHNNLPFKKGDVSAILGLRKELGSGISMQLSGKYGLTNIYTHGFDPDIANPDWIYKDVYPRFKDGTNSARHFSIELGFLFGI